MLYITIKAFLITKQVKLIRKKESTATALNLDDKIFVVYIDFLISFNIHPFCKAQIVLLKAETFIATLSEDANFIDITFLTLATKFLEYTEINNHTINLIDTKQFLYRPIYSLKPVK